MNTLLRETLISCIYKVARGTPPPRPRVVTNSECGTGLEWVIETRLAE